MSACVCLSIASLFDYCLFRNSVIQIHFKYEALLLHLFLPEIRTFPPRPFIHPSNYDLLFIQYWVIMSRLCRIFQIFLQTVLSNSTWWILRLPKDRWDIKTLPKTPGTTKVLLCETLVILPLLSFWGSSISFKLLFQIPSTPQFFPLWTPPLPRPSHFLFQESDLHLLIWIQNLYDTLIWHCCTPWSSSNNFPAISRSSFPC